MGRVGKELKVGVGSVENNGVERCWGVWSGLEPFLAHLCVRDCILMERRGEEEWVEVEGAGDEGYINTTAQQKFLYQLGEAKLNEVLVSLSRRCH